MERADSLTAAVMTKLPLKLAASLLPLLAMAAAPPASAPVTPMTPDVVASYDQVMPWADFDRREVMIPMRDGTKLYTVVVMKKGTKNGPILLTRSPYDAHGDAFRNASQRIDDIVQQVRADRNAILGRRRTAVHHAFVDPVFECHL